MMHSYELKTTAYPLSKTLKSPQVRIVKHDFTTGIQSNVLHAFLTQVTRQQEIIARFDDASNQIEQMQLLREDALKEFDALLPAAIFDKAFKGKL